MIVFYIISGLLILDVTASALMIHHFRVKCPDQEIKDIAGSLSVTGMIIALITLFPMTVAKYITTIWKIKKYLKENR